MLTMQPTAATAADYDRRVRAILSLTRPNPALVEIAQKGILDGFAENFASESAGGMRWAKLSEVTIRIRLAMGFGAGPILVRTDDYRSSWIDPGHPSHVSRVQATARGWSLWKGSAHPKAFKLERGRHNMPARPVAQLSAQSREQLRRAVDLYVFKVLTGR